MPRGACPGYVIDHINPLECGGADAPFNMQWQTIAEGLPFTLRSRCQPSSAFTPLAGIRLIQFGSCRIAVAVAYIELER
jgi:hypothetical protein